MIVQYFTKSFVMDLALSFFWRCYFLLSSLSFPVSQNPLEKSPEKELDSVLRAGAESINEVKWSDTFSG